MKATLSQLDLSALELNCLLVAIDHLIESQEELFDDLNIDSTADRNEIPEVKDRLIAAHVVKTKLHHIQGGI